MTLMNYEKPIIIYECPWIPWNTGGMCLYPFIFLRGKAGSPGTIPILVHELVHWHDQKKMGFGPFLKDWMHIYRDNLIKYGGEKEKMRAYVNIPYETRAFKAMGGTQWQVASRLLSPSSSGE